MVTQAESRLMAQATMEKAGGIPLLLYALTNAFVNGGFKSVEAYLKYCNDEPKGQALMEIYKASGFTEETSAQFIIAHANKS